MLQMVIAGKGMSVIGTGFELNDTRTGELL
jgi:hypothetical protein